MCICRAPRKRERDTETAQSPPGGRGGQVDSPGPTVEGPRSNTRLGPPWATVAARTGLRRSGPSVDDGAHRTDGVVLGVSENLVAVGPPDWGFADNIS